MVCCAVRSSSVDIPGSVSNTTSPPRPPSPPDGPPNGTNFSRRNATAPFPPFPATTFTSHESTNFIRELRPPFYVPRGRGQSGFPQGKWLGGSLERRLNGHENGANPRRPWTRHPRGARRLLQLL